MRKLERDEAELYFDLIPKSQAGTSGLEGSVGQACQS